MLNRMQEIEVGFGGVVAGSEILFLSLSEATCHALSDKACCHPQVTFPFLWASLMVDMMQALGVEGSIAAAHALTRPAEEYVNNPDVERQ